MKKGQIFILAAIIIGFLLFILATPTNIITTPSLEDDFEALSKNYQRESARFINHILQEDPAPDDVKEQFVLFSALFTSYTQTQNPHFRLLYILPYENTLIIGNYLDTPATFNPGGTLQGCFSKVHTSYSVGGLSIDFGVDASTYTPCFTTTTLPPNNLLTFTVEGTTYTFTINPDAPEVIIVTRETIGSDRKVYTGGNLIPPT